MPVLSKHRFSKAKEFLKQFIKLILSRDLSLKASSISFSFFLAFFPSLLLLLTLLPFVPIRDFQDSIIEFIGWIIPLEIYAVIKSTIIEIVKIPHTGLLSVSFVIILYSASNGVNNMTEAFNQLYKIHETRSFFRQLSTNIILIIFLSIMIIFAAVIQIAGTVVLSFLYNEGWFQEKILFFYINILKWIVIFLMIFVSIMIIFKYTPSIRFKTRNILAGGIFSSLMILLSSIGFDYYISNFSGYNKLYGSIGILLLIMFWIYFNSLILLIGFSLNILLRTDVKTSVSEDV